MQINVFDTRNPEKKYRFEATNVDYEFQSIMNGFKDGGENYFATYGSTAKIARRRLIVEIKRIDKIIKRWNEEILKLEVVK